MEHLSRRKLTPHLLEEMQHALITSQWTGPLREFSSSVEVGVICLGIDFSSASPMEIPLHKGLFHTQSSTNQRYDRCPHL